jgi:DNA replication initiation complex subunit (GINS family)
MPKRTEMTYEELMSVHRQESKQNILAKISSDFYKRLAEYIDALDGRCAEERNGSTEVSGMLLTQLKTAKEKSAEVYEIRMRKVALMAMTAAFGAEPRLDNATQEEKEAFETLKKFFIDHCKKTLTAECEGEQSVEPVVQEKEAVKDRTEEKAPAVTATPKSTEHSEIILVRILEDLPAFAGTDKNYQLAKEDIISLPRNIAEILVKHNKAIEIRQSS